jgi:hypothetical protein
MSEFERARGAREHELRNEEIIERILVSGSDSEMKELQAVHRLTEEQMVSMRYWSRLRHETKADHPINDRETTPEENELGVRIEYIEPQVLDAVRALRQKGYKTTYSGFAQLGAAQTIWFDKKQAVALPESTQSDIEQRWGVKIRTEPGSIWIDCLETRLSIDDLKQIWSLVADAIPAVYE